MPTSATRRARRPVWRALAAGSLLSLGGALPAHPAAAASVSAAPLRDVLLVGNAVSGTVSFIDGRTFQSLGSFDAVPDLQQRLSSMTPVQWIDYQLATADEASVDPAVGGTRYVDDMTVSPDGTTLYVSRANLDDVAAFDLATHRMLWRSPVDGIHADHMALSPDGSRVVVSATTSQEAQVYDAGTGALVGKFPTGTYPHQNTFTADGKYIYNESIGVTLLPKALNLLKGALQLEKVDAGTLKVVKVWTFPYGVRPFVIAPDGTTMYADLSYLNGFIKYDLNSGTRLATVDQPFSAAAASLSPDGYPQNSAHHGIALSGDGTRLCDVGTIDDYAKIVGTSTLSTEATVSYPAGSIPYWAATSADGDYCFVSLSAGNALSVISYATGQEVVRIPVGRFPQRGRIAQVTDAAVAGLSGSAG
ncbi:YncE family protein [Actinocrinis puniceicyclus]|uniref:YncE family protein n=1 Tax=Actinocrinis puniceicyclus TaxID=977794 RepID=A0A8J7WSW2_9ACTN|nr:YncE family protein [Actinocrinis puniceicyclus]MBS2966170.1 YncE family protein [Actinocrinis puniceicyclus]